MSIASDGTPSFSSSAIAMTAPSTSYVLGGVALFQGKVYAAWEQSGVSNRIVRYNFNGSSFTTEKTYVDSNPVPSFSRAWVSLFVIGDTLYGMDSGGSIGSIAFNDANDQYTVASVTVTGDSPGSSGGTALLDGSRYIVGEVSTLRITRLSDSFVRTRLTVTGTVFASALAIEAAVAAGGALYVFQNTNRSPIVRVTIAGDTATAALLTTAAPNIAIRAAANI